MVLSTGPVSDAQLKAFVNQVPLFPAGCLPTYVLHGHVTHILCAHSRHGMKMDCALFVGMT